MISSLTPSASALHPSLEAPPTTLPRPHTASAFRLFSGPEDVWFWYCRSRLALELNGGFRSSGDAMRSPRPLEPAEVGALVRRLRLSGLLDRDRILVMEKYGNLQHAPSARCANSRRGLALWIDAMEILARALAVKGAFAENWVRPSTMRHLLSAPGPAHGIRVWRAPGAVPVHAGRARRELAQAERL